MTDIFDKIVAAKEKFCATSGNQPNMIYMNMADYRALCEWAKDKWVDESTDVNFLDSKDGAHGMPEPKPSEILGMKIIKRYFLSMKIGLTRSDCRGNITPNLA